jgi:hypothetical protein
LVRATFTWFKDIIQKGFGTNLYGSLKYNYITLNCIP